MSFVSELKRRKVFQVAAVYLVVAWLIMQVVDVVNEPLLLPDWFARVVILLLAVGFPIAVILSWAFDLTPEGVVRDEGSGAVVQRGGRRMEYVFAGLLVIAVATLLYREFTPPELAVEVVVEESQREVLPNSVAVLPFENLSPDPDNAFYADGIHIELLSLLHRIQDLTAIARDSVIRFRNSDLSNEEIARELRVEAIVRGEVRFSGNSLRVSARLIDPATNVPIWAGVFDGDLADVFGFQADIATQIAMALEAELLPSELARIENRSTDSSEALAFYLRAVAEVGGSSGIIVSEEASSEFHRYLDEAIDIDSNFALAYAAKSRDYAYSLVRDRRLSEMTTVVEIENLARDNAERALALDRELGLAHAALAVIHRFNRRWAESRASLELALKYSPNDHRVAFDFMYFNFTVGVIADAVVLGKRFAAANRSADGYTDLGTALFWSGDYDAAASAYRTAIILGPTYPRPHRTLGGVEVLRGNHTRAIEELRLSESFSGKDGTITDLATLVYFYGRAGSSENAERLLGRLHDRASEYHIGAGSWALAYLGVEDRQQALEWLNTAAETSVPDNGYINLYVIAGNLYADPILEEREFLEARRRLGFRE